MFSLRSTQGTRSSSDAIVVRFQYMPAASSSIVPLCVKKSPVGPVVHLKGG